MLEGERTLFKDIRQHWIYTVLNEVVYLPEEGPEQ
jgi:hypothetical protein